VAETYRVYFDHDQLNHVQILTALYHELREDYQQPIWKSVFREDELDAVVTLQLSSMLVVNGVDVAVDVDVEVLTVLTHSR